MAIYTERIIRVNNNKASMDKDIYIYRGNRNIEIQFRIMDHQFKFKDTNMVEQLSPSHAYVTLLNPQMKQIGTGKAEVIDGVIRLVITSAMIDEKTECGEYSIVVDLYDEIGDSVLTIPPVENQLHVLDRMTEIDDIPDELRFVFDEQTGDLNVTNIDLAYTGDGEIRTIEGIPVTDDKARKIMADLQETVNGFSANFDPTLESVSQLQSDVDRIENIVTDLSNNGYSQIKTNMTQVQIQNVLNNGGLILWREGTYEIEAGLALVSNTNLLMESRVELIVNDVDAIKLNDISDVFVDGNLILNGAGIVINDCTDVTVSNLCVTGAENGVTIVGGDNILVNNLVTQDCSVAGCKINNSSTPMNVVIDNHVDIQSSKALDVATMSNDILAGRIHVIKPFYEISGTNEPCMKINNSVNAPKIIIDRPMIQANVNKNVVISIAKDNDDSQKLGNVELIEPHLMGEGEVDSFIKINNTVSAGDISNIKVINPRCDNAGSSKIIISGDISANKSVIVDLDPNYDLEVQNDISIMDDIRSAYILPSNAVNNVSVNLSGAPVNYTCEFINKSMSYGFLIDADIIDNKPDLLELKYDDYMKLKHLGDNKWIVLDENFKNKITTIYPSLGKLEIPNARFVSTNISEKTVLTLPSTQALFTEIHLFVTSEEGGTFEYPKNVKWVDYEPYLDSDYIYEFIFTKVNDNWLIGCVTYA